MATVNTYHFNVFQLLEAGQGKGMRFLLGELLSTYGLIGNAIIQGRKSVSLSVKGLTKFKYSLNVITSECYRNITVIVLSDE